MVVARGHEAEAETAGFARRCVEIRERCHVLGRAHRSIVEGRLCTVAALSRIEPFLGVDARDGQMCLGPGVGCVLACRDGPRVARLFGFAVRETALANDLAGSPTGREVARRRFGTDRVSIFVEEDRAVVAVLIRIAMARVDLEECLSIVVVEWAFELFRPIGSGGRIEAPGRAVGDHDRGDVPVVEFFEEQVGRVGEFDAIGGKLANRHADLTRLERRVFGEVVGERVESLVPRGVQEEPGPNSAEGIRAHDAISRLHRTDRSRRDLSVFEVTEHDVLVSVMVLGGIADLRPLPAEEGDGVGFGAGAGHSVARADRVDGFAPMLRRDVFRMVVDRPEIERGAEACEVAGICGRVRSFAGLQREAQHEGVE